MPLTLNLRPEESRLPSQARSLMRKLSKLFSTTVALAVTLSPVYATQLYVPLTNYPGDGTTLEIVVTNPDTVARMFAGVIIAQGVNGNVDQGTPTPSVTVEPGSTRVVKAPPGTGLWRLHGHEGLEISARMRVPTDSPNYQGEEVPILSSDVLHPANSKVIVQSIVAAHGYLSDFVLFNGSKATARCQASVHLVSGQKIGPDFAIHVAPLSLSLFENVAAVAVVPNQVSQVRISMVCDQPYFVYTRTVNPQTGYLAIHTA